jgi:hypothetical protein
MYICSKSHASDSIRKVAAYSPTAAAKLHEMLVTYGAGAAYFAATILIARQSGEPDEHNETLMQRCWAFAEVHPDAAHLLRRAVRQFVRDVYSTAGSE